MSAEIICVGTELLLGDILNSNAQFLARELAELGIPHYYQTVVGDNPQRIQRAVATACHRAQILIFTGGLGPTPDDLTIATLANFFDSPLTERPEIIDDIARKYARRDRQMTESDRKQALLPEGAEILPNPIGSAPGIIWQPRFGPLLMAFPGVPTEMKRMWRETAVPHLKSLGWGQAPLFKRILKFWGIREAVLAEKVAEFLQMDDPTVAPYANLGEVKLRLCTRAASADDARTRLDEVEAQLRERSGEDCYGTDDDTLAVAVGRLLGDRGETLAVAESCTGGAIAAALTDVPGSSAYFHGGVVAYDNSVKMAALDVDALTLERHGAVSPDVAAQMALGTRSRLQTTWGLSVTGIAGPGGGSADKPVGLVYIGVAGPDGWREVTEHRFGDDRDRAWIRHLSTCTALDRLRRALGSQAFSGDKTAGGVS